MNKQMHHRFVLLLTTSVLCYAHVSNMTIAFSNKNIAELEYGTVKKYNANSFLSDFCYVPDAFCEIDFENEGWVHWRFTNPERGCQGYHKHFHSIIGDNTAEFSALPVFKDCKSAAIFSSLGKCIGQGETFIPLGIVARFVPSIHQNSSNHITMHSV